MGKRQSHHYEFGEFQLDVDERVLRHGSEIVPLNVKVFDTLLLLVMNAGRVVTKEELMASVWPDSFVEEGSLTQNISLIRKALERAGDERRYIETVPKRGYRFVESVREVEGGATTEVTHGAAAERPVVVTDPGGEPAADPQAAPLPDDAAGQSAGSRSASRKRLIAKTSTKTYLPLLIVLLVAGAAFLYWRGLRAGRSAGSVPQIKSIAILPFNTVGLDGEHELLGLGMADALILRLSRLDSPVVLPTGTIIRYTKRDKAALEIARDLGAEALLDGTVQRANGRVRVTAQLIRVEDGRSLWSGTLEEADRDIFRLQDSLADQLAESLASKVRGPDNSTPRPYTQNPEAYQDYLMGIYFWSKRGKEDMGKALNYFKGAVEKDPGFALAHAYLADCYYISATERDGRDSIVQNDEARALAHESVQKALALDEMIAQAHMALAGLNTLDGDYVGAEGEYQRALLLDPNFAIAHNRYGIFLFHRGDIEGTVRELRRGQELNPTSPITNQALAVMLNFARRYDESLYYARRSTELDPSDTRALITMGESFHLKGSDDEAINLFSKVVSAHKSDYLYYIAQAELIVCYASSGRQELARRKSEELLRDPKARGPIDHYALACIYAALGDRDEAFAQLSKEKHTMYAASEIRLEPLLDPLRGDPRFDQILNRPIEGYQ